MAFVVEADTLPQLQEIIAEMEKDGYSVRGEIVYSIGGMPLVMFDD